jgi:GDP-4-dehydro-6-deoxy-D-mannose reductase
VRALVTGAGGFAGQHLLRELLARGRQVVGTTLDGRAPSGGTLGEDELARVAWRALDITRNESVDALLSGERFDEVYHLAGQSSVGESFADPLATWEVNATGTLRLLLLLEELGEESTRVLIISSAEVYGSVPVDEQPVRESRAAAPVTPYGASKLGAEAVAQQAAASGSLQVVIARSFNHAGPGQDARFIFPSMARQLASFRGGEAEPVLRVGNLEARRDFLDVRDVASAYLQLMERGESGGSTTYAPESHILCRSWWRSWCGSAGVGRGSRWIRSGSAPWTSRSSAATPPDCVISGGSRSSRCGRRSRTSMRRPRVRPVSPRSRTRDGNGLPDRHGPR